MLLLLHTHALALLHKHRLFTWESSPDGASSWSMAMTRATRASKNIIMERDRRRRLNEKLYNLRGVVPNITKVSAPAPACDSSIYRSRCA